MRRFRSTPRPIPVADVGLQPERTALAWTRTALATLVASMTLLRWSEVYPDLVTAAVVMLGGIGLSIIALNRPTYRAQAVALSRQTAPPNTVSVALMTAFMLVLGVLGLILISQAS